MRGGSDGESLVEVAPAAALDTVSVAVGGYDEAPRSETVLFNLLAGFLGSFALVLLSTLGIRDEWWHFSAEDAATFGPIEAPLAESVGH